MCIRKYWVTCLEISERTCELRYQDKEPNIFLFTFNNLIIICGMLNHELFFVLFSKNTENFTENHAQISDIV